MAKNREYREDLQRDWTERPLNPGTPKEKQMIDRFAHYLKAQKLAEHPETCYRHAKELWRITRLNV